MRERDVGGKRLYAKNDLRVGFISANGSQRALRVGLVNSVEKRWHSLPRSDVSDRRNLFRKSTAALRSVVVLVEFPFV